jgi:hypothetical protein
MRFFFDFNKYFHQQEAVKPGHNDDNNNQNNNNNKCTKNCPINIKWDNVK